MNRQNELRMALVSFELLAQLRDMNVNRSRRDRRIVAPHLVQ